MHPAMEGALALPHTGMKGALALPHTVMDALPHTAAPRSSLVTAVLQSFSLGFLTVVTMRVRAHVNEG